MFYFLRKDFEDLGGEIKKLGQRIEEITKAIGESCKEDADTWHDNYAFEEGQRQALMWSSQLRELIKIKNNALVVDPNSSLDNKVSIGKIVTVIDMEIDEQKTWHIGSYMTFTNRQNIISYDTLIARLLIGSSVGDVKEGIIGGKEKRFRIVRVE